MLSNTYFMPLMLSSMAILARLYSRLQKFKRVTLSLARVLKQLRSLLPDSDRAVAPSQWLTLAQAHISKESLLLLDQKPAKTERYSLDLSLVTSLWII
jgi:hypothetical protein